MKELLDKLSSYNLFNYLLPGALFVAAAQRISAHRFHQDNIVIDLFTYYFIGLVVSRLGSLVLEPALRRTGLVEFSPYADFVTACTADPKIEILSEQNNMFRTLAALCLALFAFKGFDVAALRLGFSLVATWSMTGLALFVLFVLAYRKQSSYIRNRVAVRVK